MSRDVVRLAMRKCLVFILRTGPIEDDCSKGEQYSHRRILSSLFLGIMPLTNPANKAENSERRDRPGGNPIFELIEADRHIKIYANGVVEGVSEGRIINHISVAIRPELFVYFSKSHDSDAMSVPNASANPNVFGSSRLGTSQTEAE